MVRMDCLSHLLQKNFSATLQREKETKCHTDERLCGVRYSHSNTHDVLTPTEWQETLAPWQKRDENQTPAAKVCQQRYKK